MSRSACPQCGTEGSGNFCARCGASLGGISCPSCGSDSRPGQRFCTSCGTPLGGGARGAAAGGGGDGGGDGALGWWMAGLLMVALILFVLVQVLPPDQGRRETAGGAGPAAGGQPATGAGGQQLGPAPNVDLSSMTPRQAADRLFDRVMRAAEAGDSTQARTFLPMAMAAYERARPLNADGLFHLSVLQRTALEHEEALATARAGLEENPDHVLLLAAAGEAARLSGDTAEARTHFSHLLEVYDEEVASDREDYQAHARILPQLRDDARSFVEGS